MNKKFYKKTKILDSSHAKTDEIVSQGEEESNQNSTLLFSKLASSATDSSAKQSSNIPDAQAGKNKAGKRGRTTTLSTDEASSSENQPKRGKNAKTGSDGNTNNNDNYFYCTLLYYYE